jgi:hypothetical protein
MTVRATHNTFGNLHLGLGDALGKADVAFFDAVDMVEIQGTRITKAAINATCSSLVLAQPSAEGNGSRVGRTVDLDTVLRISQPTLAPLLRLDWIVRPLARLSIRLSHLLGMALTPAPIRLPHRLPPPLIHEGIVL